MSSGPEIKEVIREWLPTVVCVESVTTAEEDPNGETFVATLDNGKRIEIQVTEQ